MSVGNIPGIGFAYEQRLNNVGIYNANQLFVQYHLLQQNYAAFTFFVAGKHMWSNYSSCQPVFQCHPSSIRPIRLPRISSIDLNYDFTDEVVCSLELIRTEIIL